MRPDVVVEEAELGERAVEGVKRIDREAIELRFERTEEALHAAVLPRAAGIGSLVPDAEDQQLSTGLPPVSRKVETSASRITTRATRGLEMWLCIHNIPTFLSVTFRIRGWDINSTILRGSARHLSSRLYVK